MNVLVFSQQTTGIKERKWLPTVHKTVKECFTYIRSAELQYEGEEQ